MEPSPIFFHPFRLFTTLSLALAASLLLSGCGLRIHLLQGSEYLSADPASIRVVPSHFSFPAGRPLQQGFQGMGGIGPYTYTILSGPGTIDPSTGVYSSSAGERLADGSTTIEVRDSSGRSGRATFSHQPFTVENEPTNGGVRALLSYGNWKFVGGNFPGANGEAIPQTLVAIDSVTNENVKRGIFQKINGIV